jgi:hypothetical protein
MWLVSIEPHIGTSAIGLCGFETRQEARRAAVEIKLSGDWSTQATAGDPTPLR